jgi:predicted DNA-binding transcriptional regulator AlpA
MIDPLLTKQELAVIMGRTTKTIDRWVASGVAPPHIRINNRNYWKRETVVDWLESHQAG